MTKLYEMVIRVSIKVEADTKKEAQQEAFRVANVIKERLPIGASVKAVTGESLKQI